MSVNPERSVIVLSEVWKMLEIRMIALGYGQVIKNKFLLTKAGKKKMSQIKKKLVGTEVAISFTPGYRARSRNGI